MRRLRHPSRETLNEWLNGESTAEIDQHVAVCQRCASTLEQLDTADQLGIAQALTQVLTVPEDLSDRLTAGVNAKLSSRQMLTVVADLFGAGLEASRLMLIEVRDDDD